MARWRMVIPAASHAPRKRTAPTSTSVTASKDNPVLGPLPSLGVCNASRHAARRWPICRSIVRCPSACRAILQVIGTVSFLASTLAVRVDGKRECKNETIHKPLTYLHCEGMGAPNFRQLLKDCHLYLAPPCTGLDRQWDAPMQRGRSWRMGVDVRRPVPGTHGAGGLPGVIVAAMRPRTHRVLGGRRGVLSSTPFRVAAESLECRAAVTFRQTGSSSAYSWST